MPTLEPVLEQIFRDWTPELRANVERFNAWVDEQPDRPEGQIVNIDDKRRVHPTLGPITHELRGQIIERASAPQTLWHFEKAASMARALQGPARERLANLLAMLGDAESDANADSLLAELVGALILARAEPDQRRSDEILLRSRAVLKQRFHLESVE